MARIRIQISLATKCQILFGLAVVMLLVAALSVPWFRMQKLVEEGQREIARKLADAWVEDLIRFGQTPAAPKVGADDRSLRLTVIDHEAMDVYAESDPLVAEARRRFESESPAPTDVFRAALDKTGRPLYRYLRAVRQGDLESARVEETTSRVANPLRAMLLIELRAPWAGDQLFLNQLYLATAGGLAGVLAIAVFWFILTRIVLSPVRVLRETAEKVAEGDLNIRSDINTGDEFEQLSDTFNVMLIHLKEGRDQLTELNEQLDLKVGELAETNTSLHEANRLKGDFLASVSHELRTPLNSIIGFAEVLVDAIPAMSEDAEKRRRYAENILNSSRSLLQLITELLDLAKIEAGRVELHVDSMPVDEACENLLGLMRPQADRKQIELVLKLEKSLPVVRTDPGKFRQILFNFLSNAIKFTPEGGRVELGAARDDDRGVRIWVRDNGPGIPLEMHREVFEKFRQLDATHTREHGGAGLGLAISQELAKLLRGAIELDSDTGRGCLFTLWVPMDLEEPVDALMPDAEG